MKWNSVYDCRYFWCVSQRKNPNDSNNSASSIIVRSLYYPPPIHRLHMRIGSGIRLSRLGRGVTAVTRVTHCHNTGHRSHTGHTIAIHWCCQRLCRIKMDSQLWKRQSLSRHKERALVHVIFLGDFSSLSRAYYCSYQPELLIHANLTHY